MGEGTASRTATANTPPKSSGPRDSRPVRRQDSRDRLPDGRHGPLDLSGDGQSEVVEGVALLLEIPPTTDERRLTTER